MFTKIKNFFGSLFKKEKAKDITINTNKVDIIALRKKLMETGMMEVDECDPMEVYLMNRDDPTQELIDLIALNESKSFREGFFEFPLEEYPNLYDMYKLIPEAFIQMAEKLSQAVNSSFHIYNLIDEEDESNICLTCKIQRNNFAPPQPTASVLQLEPTSIRADFKKTKRDTTAVPLMDRIENIMNSGSISKVAIEQSAKIPQIPTPLDNTKAIMFEKPVDMMKDYFAPQVPQNIEETNRIFVDISQFETQEIPAPQLTQEKTIAMKFSNFIDDANKEAVVEPWKPKESVVTKADMPDYFKQLMGAK